MNKRDRSNRRLIRRIGQAPVKLMALENNDSEPLKEAG